MKRWVLSEVSSHRGLLQPSSHDHGPIPTVATGRWRRHDACAAGHLREGGAAGATVVGPAGADGAGALSGEVEGDKRGETW